MPGVNVKHPGGFCLNMRVAGEDPRPVPPGFMASSESQRQIVLPEISATRPRFTTSLAISGTCSRDNGTPRREGSSQARAFAAITTSGGKAGHRPPFGRSPRPVRPCSKNLLRHLGTISRRLSSRAAISSLSSHVLPLARS
jgi:hypothetical protein